MIVRSNIFIKRVKYFIVLFAKLLIMDFKNNFNVSLAVIRFVYSIKIFYLNAFAHAKNVVCDRQLQMRTQDLAIPVTRNFVWAVNNSD